MADGAELSLDDYIKTKKQRGGFKVGRKGLGGNKNSPKKQKTRGGGGGGLARGNKQQNVLNRSNNQGQGQQNRRNRQRGGGKFANNRTQFQNRSPKNQRFQGTRNRGGGLQQKRVIYQGNQRQIGGISQHLVVNNRRQFGRRGNRQGTAGFRGTRGIAGGNLRPIQPLMGRLVNVRSPGVSRINLYGSNNIQRAPNKRVVQKLAKKRVQKARLQLAKRNVAVRGRASLGLFTSPSRVKLTRNGLVTVRDPAEKQLQRLIIQNKIQRAQVARNKGRFPNVSLSRGNMNMSAQIQRRTPNRRPRYIPQIQQQQQVISRMMPSRVEYAEEYDPFEPQLVSTARGSMYADIESPQRGGVPRPQGGGLAGRPRSQWSPPIIRTARNNNYQADGPNYDTVNETLNPEIQRKISFIQSRNRPSQPAEIIPDFRAPIVTSTMKLGDRFKLYMH